MAELITMAQAKSHLRIDDNDQDSDLSLKMLQAETAVRDYITESEIDWGTPGPPATIQAAALLMLSDLWANRGDGELEQGQADGYLPKTVTRLLYRHRDPTLA